MAWRDQIEETVNRETHAWDKQDVEIAPSVFHPDIVWPWPPTADSHDPENWVIAMGRFDRRRSEWTRLQSLRQGEDWKMTMNTGVLRYPVMQWKRAYVPAS